jgi:hypothetical protein
MKDKIQETANGGESEIQIVRADGPCRGDFANMAELA